VRLNLYKGVVNRLKECLQVSELTLIFCGKVVGRLVYGIVIVLVEVNSVL
jgi:hypothetical protein